MQVSAVGVWGAPLEVASRAADIVAALPIAPLLKKRYSAGCLFNIHARMLMVLRSMYNLLDHKQALPPDLSKEVLLGRWGPL
jgi:hypothetical protein